MKWGKLVNGAMPWTLVHFPCYIIFYCSDITPFLVYSPSDGHLDCFLFFFFFCNLHLETCYERLLVHIGKDFSRALILKLWSSDKKFCLHPWPTELESLWVGPSDLGFHKLSRWYQRLSPTSEWLNHHHLGWGRVILQGCQSEELWLLGISVGLGLSYHRVQFC